MGKLYEKYPGIAKAALEIAYDNGGINRDRSERKQRAELDRFLANYPLDLESLEAIDKWLTGISDEDMDTICCGEESDQNAVLANAPPWTAKLLEDYFNEVC